MALFCGTVGEGVLCWASMSDGGMYLGVASQSNELLREFQKFKELIR